MLKIGVITDMQYADAEPSGKRVYRDSIPKFLEAVGIFESEGVDAVFHLGDAVNGGWDNLTVVSELFHLIRKPFYNLLGNHDFLIPDEKKDEICRCLCIPEPCGYYSFLMDDPDSEDHWRFLFLNGNEISLYAARSDQERNEAEKIRQEYLLDDGSLPEEYNGAMTQTQLDWIDAELASAENKGENVILCNHFPLFSQGGSLSLSSSIPFANILPVYYSKMGYSQWNADKLFELIDRYSSVIKGYWAGHLHAGAYGVRNGIPHITFQGMVETQPNAWAIMELKDGAANIS